MSFVSQQPLETKCSQLSSRLPTTWQFQWDNYSSDTFFSLVSLVFIWVIRFRRWNAYLGHAHFPHSRQRGKKNQASRAKILGNPASRRAVNSRIPSKVTLRFSEFRTIFWPNPRSWGWISKTCLNDLIKAIVIISVSKLYNCKCVSINGCVTPLYLEDGRVNLLFD